MIIVKEVKKWVTMVLPIEFSIIFLEPIWMRVGKTIGLKDWPERNRNAGNPCEINDLRALDKVIIVCYNGLMIGNLTKVKYDI